MQVTLSASWQAASLAGQQPCIDRQHACWMHCRQELELISMLLEQGQAHIFAAWLPPGAAPLHQRQ